MILKGVLEEPNNDEDSPATLNAKRFYKNCMDIRECYCDIMHELLNEIILSAQSVYERLATNRCAKYWNRWVVGR